MSLVELKLRIFYEFEAVKKKRSSIDIGKPKNHDTDDSLNVIYTYYRDFVVCLLLGKRSLRGWISQDFLGTGCCLHSMTDNGF